MKNCGTMHTDARRDAMQTQRRCFCSLLSPTHLIDAMGAKPLLPPSTSPLKSCASLLALSHPVFSAISFYNSIQCVEFLQVDRTHDMCVPLLSSIVSLSRPCTHTTYILTNERDAKLLRYAATLHFFLSSSLIVHSNKEHNGGSGTNRVYVVHSFLQFLKPGISHAPPSQDVFRLQIRFVSRLPLPYNF